jgi:sarcosine oxidase subunit delta
MLLIPCPYCGERPELEFLYGGQAHVSRPAGDAVLSEQEWADYLYQRDNTRGMHAERWRHFHGCGRFFNLLRDTTSDRIQCSYCIGAQPPAAAAAGEAVP